MLSFLNVSSCLSIYLSLKFYENSLDNVWHIKNKLIDTVELGKYISLSLSLTLSLSLSLSQYIYACVCLCMCLPVSLSLSLYIYIYIYIYIYECVKLFVCVYIRGSLNKFPDFFRMGTFIDSTHIKL